MSALVFLVATFVLGAILGGVVNGFTDSPDPVVVALYVASTIVQALADAVAPGQMRSDEVMQARLWHVVSGREANLEVSAGAPAGDAGVTGPGLSIGALWGASSRGAPGAGVVGRAGQAVAAAAAGAQAG